MSAQAATVSQAVQELLQPIHEDSPVGEDLDIYEPPYQLAEMAITQNVKDYVECEKHCKDILKKSSKHLQIVSWLTLCWLKSEGIIGFRNGLQVLHALIRTYGASVFPVEAKAKIKSIHYLEKNGLVKTLLGKVKLGGNGELIDAAQDVLTLLPAISTEVEQVIFEGKSDTDNKGGSNKQIGVQFDAVANLVNEKLAAAGITVALESEPNVESTLPDNLAELAAASIEGVESEPASELVEEADTTQENEDTIEEEEYLPWEVEELLEEILGDSPVGEDIEHTENQDAMAAFLGLQSEIEKVANNNYAECVTLSKEILTEYSKHLRVAMYLAMAWFRTEGLTGLKKGILLIIKFLESFDGKVYPQKEKDRISIIQKFNVDRRFSVISKVLLGNEKAQFSVTDSKLKDLSSFAKDTESRKEFLDLGAKLKPLKGTAISGTDEFVEKLKGLLQQDELKDKGRLLTNHFMDQKAGREKITFLVTERSIKELKGAGLPGDMAHRLKEEMLGKEFKGWAQCYDNIDLALGALPAKMYRPILEPFLNKTTQDILSIDHYAKQLVDLCEAQFEKTPQLSKFLGVITELVKRAKTYREVGEKNLKKRLAEKEASERGTTPSRGKQQRSEINEVDGAQKPDAPTSTGPVTIGRVTIEQEREAIEAIKKGVQFFFREEEGAEELIMDPWVYTTVREFRWGAVVFAPKDETVDVPNQAWCNKLHEKSRALESHSLIREIEAQFIERRELLYWFDGQRLVVEAFLRLGDAGNSIADGIKRSLAVFLTRFPGIEELHYKKGKKDEEAVPFASVETREWIKEHVVNMFGQGGGQFVLPPLLGEEYSEINEAYIKACEAFPDQFDENAQAMHDAIAVEPRKRGRFLIRLNLANYNTMASHYVVARSIFNQLIREINEYRIADWEPALCASVWKGAYLNNVKLLKQGVLIDESQVHAQQHDLIEWISMYNGLMAVKLINNTY